MGKSGWGRISQEFRSNIYTLLGFPSGSGVKNPPANAADTDLIPGLGTKIPHAARGGQRTLKKTVSLKN